MRGHLRRLRDDGGVEIDDGESREPDFLRDLAKERAAVRVPVLRVRIGKVQPDVPERGRAEQRVAHRVDQHVGVGVPREPLFEGNRDAADDELPPLDERVHVVTLPDSHGMSRRSPSAILRSEGKVIFRFLVLPSTSFGL